jgi:glycosyltransferase involved in cell wall biosynthesis
MVAECDVGLLSLDRGLKTQNFPGKMLSYMDQGKPILASINPGNDLQDILEEHGAGLVCANGDDRGLEAHARRLVREDRLRQQMGSRARSLLEESFSVSRAARQILSSFDISVSS